MSMRCGWATSAALAAWTLLFSCAVAVGQEADSGNALHALAGKPEKPRFELTDRVWPAKPGEAAVCLWADDKLAAASITIDDNWAPDHPWWIAMGEKTGFRFTWFVITERVGGGLWGTWDDFRKLKTLGHDVQSHTVSHLRGELDIVAEYRDSKATLEKEIPDHRVIVLAYPGGKHTVQNDPAVAARYYIAGRGTVGAPNQANRTDYLQTNSATINEELVNKILDKEQLKRGLYGYYRGWLCSHYHGVRYGKTDEEKQANAEKIAANLMYLKSKEADVWVGLFREVVLYGQQRDTATLKVAAADDKGIRFVLTDRMDDALYSFPLTVKVRVDNAWTTVAATQGDKPVEARLVEHEGGKFALVKAVPDRGEVTLRPAAPSPATEPRPL